MALNLFKSDPRVKQLKPKDQAVLAFINVAFIMGGVFIGVTTVERSWAQFALIVIVYLAIYECVLRMFKRAVYPKYKF